MRLRYVPALLLLFAASPALAWHWNGHRLTAQIAFDLLSEQQQQQVTAILRAHPRFDQDFAPRMPDDVANDSELEQARWLIGYAANWPDVVDDLDAKSRDRYHRSSWHYINLPVFLTAADETALKGKIKQNLSTRFSPPLEPGMNSIQALTGNLLVWLDDSTSVADKAVALCWILHLTGDMHQPLHNVALFSADYFPRGDLGGNLIKIKRPKRNTNLHAVWDGLANGLETLTPEDALLEQLANDEANIDMIARWSMHYRDFAADHVYTPELRRRLLALPASNEEYVIDLPRQYLDRARELAKSQIIIAGHRIAALIAD